MHKKKHVTALAGFAGTALILALSAGAVFAQSPSGGSIYNINTGNIATTTTPDNTASIVATSTQATSADAIGGAIIEPGDTPVAFAPSAEQMTLLNTGALTIGSTGTEVMSLQGFLAELGFLDLTGIGGPTGYFGKMTRDAVARYQSAIGVPATGYFGPLTRNSMAMHFVRNNWIDNLSGVNGMAAADITTENAGANTGGPEVKMTGIFSATNPGYTFNGVWYPNMVNMNVAAPTTEEATSTDTGTSSLDVDGDYMGP